MKNALQVAGSLIALGLFFRFLLKILQGPVGPRDDFNPDGMTVRWLQDRRKGGI